MNKIAFFNHITKAKEHMANGDLLAAFDTLALMTDGLIENANSNELLEMLKINNETMDRLNKKGGK